MNLCAALFNYTLNPSRFVHTKDKVRPATGRQEIQKLSMKDRRTVALHVTYRDLRCHPLKKSCQCGHGIAIHHHKRNGSGDWCQEIFGFHQRIRGDAV